MTNQAVVMDLRIGTSQPPPPSRPIFIDPEFEYQDEETSLVLQARLDAEFDAHPETERVPVIGIWNPHELASLIEDIASKPLFKSTVVLMKPSATAGRAGVVPLIIGFRNGACHSVHFVQTVSNPALTDHDAGDIGPSCAIRPRRYIGPHVRTVASTPSDCAVLAIEDTVSYFYERPVQSVVDMRLLQIQSLARFCPRNIAHSFIDRQMGVSEENGGGQKVSLIDARSWMGWGVLDLSTPRPDSHWWERLSAEVVDSLGLKADEAIVINPFMPYSQITSYLITTVCLREAFSVTQLEDIVVVPSSLYENRHSVIYLDNKAVLLGTSLLDAAIPHVLATRSHSRKVKLLSQVSADVGSIKHVLALMLVALGGHIIDAIFVDSSNFVEMTPSKAQIAEQAVLDLMDATGPRCPIFWHRGLDQTGPACSVYTVENLVRLAAGKTAIAGTVFSLSPYLIRLRHARLLWAARHQFNFLKVEGTTYNVFEYVYKVQTPAFAIQFPEGRDDIAMTAPVRRRGSNRDWNNPSNTWNGPTREGTFGLKLNSDYYGLVAVEAFMVEGVFERAHRAMVDYSKSHGFVYKPPKSRMIAEYIEEMEPRDQDIHFMDVAIRLYLNADAEVHPDPDPESIDREVLRDNYYRAANHAASNKRYAQAANDADASIELHKTLDDVIQGAVSTQGEPWWKTFKPSVGPLITIRGK